jgi:prevent-host-death family protein
MALQVMSVSDVKARISDVLERVSSSKEPLYIARRSKVDVVMLSVAVYENMLAELEDARDAELLRQAQEHGGHRRPYAEVRRELVAEGLLSDDVPS